MKHRYRPGYALLLTLLLGSFCSCSKPQGKSEDTVVKDGYDVQEMQAATARAQREVDNFIGELSKGNGADFAVKAPISGNGQVEHFWLADVVYKDGEFTGVINNDPSMVTTVKLGQKWTIKRGEISDWMFMRDGKMHGNYTLRPLLKTLPADQAAELKSILAEP